MAKGKKLLVLLMMMLNEDMCEYVDRSRWTRQWQLKREEKGTYFPRGEIHIKVKTVIVGNFEQRLLKGTSASRSFCGSVLHSFLTLTFFLPEYH